MSCKKELAHPPCGSREQRLVVILAEFVESLVDGRENFVRFVDHTEIEGLRCEKCIAALLAPCRLAPDEEDSVAVEAAGARLSLVRVDVEQLIELLPPLPEQRFGGYEENASR